MSIPISRRQMHAALLAGSGLLAAGAPPLRAQRRQGWLFIGTYTRGSSKGIYRIPFPADSGDWGQPELAAETPSPSFLAVSPNGKALFAVNEVGEFQGEKSGSVSAFGLDSATGSLTARNVVSSRGGGPCHLALGPSGRTLVVANYGGGSVASYRVQPDGTLSDAASFVQHTGKGAHPRRQTAPHAHGIAIGKAAGETIAWVADLGIDQVLAYRLDDAQATLTPRQAQPSVPLAPGAGPRHVVLHRTLPFAFAINELTSTITAFAMAAKTGIWTEIHTVSTLPNGYSGENTTAEIAVHPSGRFVYGSNRGHDSIATFSLDPKSGRLQLLAHTPTQGKMPRNFALHPNGRWLVAANQNSGNLVLFSVDPKRGVPVETGKAQSVDFPVCALFSA